MNDLPKWAMRDPFDVVSRLEEQEQRQMERSKHTKQEKAKRELEKLFEGKADEKQH